jgi:hypothetical protein
MLRTNPTRLELKQEDIRELEDVKASWNKLNTSKRRNPEFESDGNGDGGATKRDVIRNRIGYSKK